MQRKADADAGMDAGEVGEDVEDVGGDAGDRRGELYGSYRVFEGWARWHQEPVAKPGMF